MGMPGTGSRSHPGRAQRSIGRRAPLDSVPLRKPPQPARARPHSPPPAPAGPGAALHGSRPPARASVRLSPGDPDLASCTATTAAPPRAEVSSSNTAPEVMRGECASEKDSGWSWGRGKAIRKRIGWVVVREVHVLEVGPQERLLGGARGARRNLIV